MLVLAVARHTGPWPPRLPSATGPCFSHFVRAVQLRMMTRLDGCAQMFVFTAADPDRVGVNTAAKRDKHAADVEAAGDEFVAPAFTPSGTPYPSAIKFFRRIAHSGDKLDRSAGRDAPRFHHECTASTFMTPTHVAFMVHMCAAATARASAKAARLYAHERATRHSLRENPLNRPAIIPAPF